MSSDYRDYLKDRKDFKTTRQRGIFRFVMGLSKMNTETAVKVFVAGGTVAVVAFWLRSKFELPSPV